MTKQVFETVDTFKNYKLQFGTKGDARITSYDKVFRRFTGQNKMVDARKYFENLKLTLK